MARGKQRRLQARLILDAREEILLYLGDEDSVNLNPYVRFMGWVHSGYGSYMGSNYTMHPRTVAEAPFTVRCTHTPSSDEEVRVRFDVRSGRFRIAGCIKHDSADVYYPYKGTGTPEERYAVWLALPEYEYRPNTYNYVDYCNIVVD